MTFNEKLIARKLSKHPEVFAVCSDKVQVKRYVEDRLGSAYVIPTIWSGQALPERLPSEWPSRFVVKANHSSGTNLFIYGDAASRWHEIQFVTAGWMKHQLDPAYHEPWYADIHRQLLVEEMIGTPGAPPTDFKFFVFKGEVHLIQVDSDRFSDHRRDLYSPTWERLPVRYVYRPTDKGTEKPKHLEQMLAAASRLGQDFEFVRVDLYDLDDGFRFGEITFAPESGYGRFSPDDLDWTLGAAWA